MLCVIINLSNLVKQSLGYHSYEVGSFLFLMTTYGKVDEFEVSKEEWAQYEERLTQFFSANDIDNAAKRAVLLSVIGPTTYKVL